MKLLARLAGMVAPDVAILLLLALVMVYASWMNDRYSRGECWYDRPDHVTCSGSR